MADKIKTAIKVASPTAGIGLTLAELRDKKKKGDFQKGDYSDIEIKDKDKDNSISNKKIKKFLEKKENKVKKTAKNLSELKGAKPGIEIPTGKIQAYKSGGRAGYSVGGKAIKGVSKIPGATANRWKKNMDDLDETGKMVRRFTQKLKKEKRTESGISKGKDLKD